MTRFPRTAFALLILVAALVPAVTSHASDDAGEAKRKLRTCRVVSPTLVRKI